MPPPSVGRRGARTDAAGGAAPTPSRKRRAPLDGASDSDDGKAPPKRARPSTSGDAAFARALAESLAREDAAPPPASTKAAPPTPPRSRRRRRRPATKPSPARSPAWTRPPRRRPRGRQRRRARGYGERRRPRCCTRGRVFGRRGRRAVGAGADPEVPAGLEMVPACVIPSPRRRRRHDAPAAAPGLHAARVRRAAAQPRAAAAAAAAVAAAERCRSGLPVRHRRRGHVAVRRRAEVLPRGHHGRPPRPAVHVRRRLRRRRLRGVRRRLVDQARDAAVRRGLRGKRQASRDRHRGGRRRRENRMAPRPSEAGRERRARGRGAVPRRPEEVPRRLQDGRAGARRSAHPPGCFSSSSPAGRCCRARCAGSTGGR